MNQIKVNIGTIVLDGVNFHDHKRIVSEFNQELRHLLVRQGFNISNNNQNGMSYSETSKNTKPQSVGQQLAHSVYANLNTQVSSNQNSAKTQPRM